MSAAHDLFQRARRAADRPNHAPTVALIMTRDMRKEITADAELHQFLLMNGALPSAQRWMKRNHRPTEEEPVPEQLLLQWPERLQDLVERIDRDALYVPSLDEYVPLTPEIGKPALHEAAKYLREHGEDTLRVATLVEQLARLM